MKNIFLILFVVIIFSSCKKDESKPDPIACFNADTYETADEAHVFSFASCSQNATYFEWDFGDGSFPSGYPNTTHIYYMYGNFNVRLTATASDGVTTSTTTKTVTIGHYSISKIKFTSVVSPLPMQCRLRTSYDTLALVNVNTPTDLPHIISFPDSPSNDVTTLFPVYYFDELDSAGNVIWTGSHGTTIQDIGASSGLRLDVSLAHGAGYDVFSIYYTFVNR